MTIIEELPKCAYSAGCNAWLREESRDSNPYPEGSKQREDWFRAYDRPRLDGYNEDLYRAYRRMINPQDSWTTIAKKFLKQVPAETVRLAEECADACTFDRRRYGDTTFTWPHTPEGCRDIIGDPWQAVVYPRAVLMADLITQNIVADFERSRNEESRT